MPKLPADFMTGLARLLATALLGTVALAGPVNADERETFFETKVRPVFAEHCFSCHGAKKERGGLRLDNPAFLTMGSDTGPVVVKGKPAESLLIKAMEYQGDTQMPPKGKIPDAQIADVKRWIADGAYWPETGLVSTTETAAAPDPSTHWAFQPVANPVVPPLEGSRLRTWARTPVDRFIARALEQKGLVPSAEADRPTLLRRLSYDLTGLPPSFEELTAFERDTSPTAYENAVDRLLASPHYGERWGRIWLDVARYADTKGYVFMEERKYPSAFKYRDWVVSSLNADMPYNQFLIAQIAGDLLDGPDDRKPYQAMGFLTLGRRFLNNRHDIIDDRIDVVSRGTLGLTVACARCHDHKFDPIPTADYYSLYGIFASSQEIKEEGPKALSLRQENPFQPVVFLRGNPGNRGPKVPRQFLSVASMGKREPYQSGGRLELARAIANEQNPLTARVIVNRVWMNHFGNGLVQTPSDFGIRTERPSHPELLDYLAWRFVHDDQWSLKKLHRLLVTSAVYRQVSENRDDARQADPENRLLWRMNRRRLTFEEIRDSFLVSAGRLDKAIGGPAVDIGAAPFPLRRTIYGFIDRQNLPGMYRTFDFASPDAHSPQRYLTTVPQQALFMMNNPFVIEQAEAVAERSLAGQPASDDPIAVRGRIERMYQLILGRSATPDESAIGLRFLTAASRAEHANTPTWEYGFGSVGPDNKQVQFSPLPHYRDQAWYPTPQFPDTSLGHLFIRARTGHPGRDGEHATILRWNAPGDGVISIRGRLKHDSANGDGVRARIVSSRLGIIKEWVAHHAAVGTGVPNIEVKVGDKIDFIVDCRTGDNSDSYDWVPVITSVQAAGGTMTWNAAEQFRGPVYTLTRWEQYAQALLLTNEYLFVD